MARGKLEVSYGTASRFTQDFVFLVEGLLALFSVSGFAS